MAPPKPKLTKKQQKKLEKERLEELKRIKDEDDENKRLAEIEMLKAKGEKQAVKEAQFALEERGRLNIEESELAQFYLKLSMQTKQADAEVKEKEDWNLFLQCNDRADPNVETDVTTLLSKYGDMEIEEKLKVVHIFDMIQEVEDQNRQLESIKQKNIIESNTDKCNWCDYYIDEFRKITKDKVNQITSHFSNNWDVLLTQKLEEINKKTVTSKYQGGGGPSDQQVQRPEILIMHGYEDIKYGIWLFAFEKTGPRPKPIDFKDLKISSEVPRTLVPQKLTMNLQWTSYDYTTPKDVYCPETVVGGVYTISCYHFQHQPEPYKDWTLKRVYNNTDSQTQHQYPPVDSTGVINYQNATPVRIFWHLPSYQYVRTTDTIKVVLWDKREQKWSTEHVDDASLDFENRILNVAVVELAPLAYIQPKNTDFPYQSWKIRCTGDECAILDIEGKRLSLRFEITPGYVYLRNRDEPCLAHIVDKAWLPSDLLYELQKCGINLLPTDEDVELCEMPLKNIAAEFKAIEDISMAVRAYYISSSKWNHSAFSNDQVVLRMRSNPEYDEEFQEDQEKDWSSISWWENKCAVLKLSESSKVPKTKRLKGTLTHSNLYTLLKNADLANYDTLNKFVDLHYVSFINTIMKFLKHIRLISFTYNPPPPKETTELEDGTGENTQFNGSLAPGDDHTLKLDESKDDGVRKKSKKKSRNSSKVPAKSKIQEPKKSPNKNNETQPKIEIEQPKIEIEQPKIEIEQPKIEIEQPKIEIDEPKTETNPTN